MSKNNRNNFFFSSASEATTPFFNPKTIQPKLKIGRPDDKYEREADRVADAVVSTPEPQVQPQAGVNEEGKTLQMQAMDDKEKEEKLQMKSLGAEAPALQRKCAGCEEKEKLQKKSDSGATDTASGYAGPAISSQLKSSAGTGRRLSGGAQSEMSQKMGADFSGVSVHTDSKSVQMNQRLGAKAFTYGRDIYFNRGQYRPETPAGKQLLAHELTHVLQQSGGVRRRIQRHVMENDPAGAPSMGCNLPSNSVSDYMFNISFAVGGSALTENDKIILANFATEWNLSPVQPIVRVDGFASIDGGPAKNWPLSCNRASIVAAELNAPSKGGKPGIPAGQIEFLANGETDRFSSSLAPNRIAAIHAPGMNMPTSNEPSVHDWTVNNAGSTDTNNCCSVCPVNLGVNCDAPNFKNGIEFVVSIRDHDPLYSYDIKRTKETKYHRKFDLPFGFSGPWQTVTAWNKPAGSDDDSHNADECLVPVANGSVHNIFSEDRPGFRSLSNGYDAYLQKINFIEFVRFTRSDGSIYESFLKQNWHTILLIEKNGGIWSINTAVSEIGPGHLPNLDP